MVHDLKVKEGSDPEQKQFEFGAFPLVLQAEKEKDATLQDAQTWLRANLPMVEEKLLKHGAILFRDFPLASAEDFDAMATAFGYENLPYVGGAAPRNVVVGNVYTTNESPPEKVIPFHHEMAQVPNWPRKLFFYCQLAAQTGGETPILHSNEIYKVIKSRFPAYVEKLEKLGTKYVRVMGPVEDRDSAIGRSWKDTFLCQTKEEAEKKCKETDLEFEWLGEDLKTISKTPLWPIQEDARTGKKVWFNSIVAAYTGWNDARNVSEKCVIYGNGDYIEKEYVLGTKAAMDELAVAFKWQKGDLLMIDNRQALHARKPFTGPRQIYAWLTKN